MIDLCAVRGRRTTVLASHIDKMGGTASVLPHNKAKETSLLRLYNRHRRDDTSLSEHKLLARDVEDSKVWPGGISIIGKCFDALH